MKPTFSVKYLDAGIAPSVVQFTDTDPVNSRIVQFDFGDGHLYRWDIPNQLSVTHTYVKAGTFQAKALNAKNEISDYYPVTVKSPPTPPTPPTPPPIPIPESFWQRFLNWLKGLFGF